MKNIIISIAIMFLITGTAFCAGEKVQPEQENMETAETVYNNDQTESKGSEAGSFTQPEDAIDESGALNTEDSISEEAKESKPHLEKNCEPESKESEF